MNKLDVFIGGMLKEVQNRQPAMTPKPELPAPRVTGFYKKGDVIGGKYEILGTLGRGGFGVVYCAYNRETNTVCALKTFRDELLASVAARDAFKKEALLWVNLGEHPFILAARYVDGFSGRLFVQMEYIKRDESRRATLADHLASARRPFETGQTLKWGVQFCLGMEHAQAHGVAAHRDIKPGNILIGKNGTLKISDFGLATAAEAAVRENGSAGGLQVATPVEGGFGLSLVRIGGQPRCGTIGYMAPEVYRGEGADMRSDIYSFGLVLWQMAAGSSMPPFVTPYPADLETYMRETYEHQMTGHLPRVDKLLYPVIERCLQPQPRGRWNSFKELRGALELMLEHTAGSRIEIPQSEENTAGFWIRKGGSLQGLGRFQEAVHCFENALAMDPQNALAWHNQGNSLISLKQFDEGLKCAEKALEIDPQFILARLNKGVALSCLGRLHDAIACYDEVLAINAKLAHAWINKGDCLAALDRHQEAVVCFDRGLEMDPRSSYAWCNKGISLYGLGQRLEAMGCYEQALMINPQDKSAWYNKAVSFRDLGRFEEEIRCFDRILALNPRFAEAWNDKGVALKKLGRWDEAIRCMDQAIGIDPQYAYAWFNKGSYLERLGRNGEAAASYRRFIEAAPPDDTRLRPCLERARKRLNQWNR